MTFYKFTIIKESKSQDPSAPSAEQEEANLINSQHIVSIKPIRVVLKENLFEGYWIRLSNGKKYRALDVPIELKNLLDASAESTGKKVSKIADDQSLFIH